MDEPDQIQKVGVVHDLLDGSILEQVRGFHKVISPTVSANATAAERRFLAKFIVSDDKTLKYGNYVSGVVCDEDLASEWLEDCEYGREFTFRLVDHHVYQSWDDGITGEDLIYISDVIEITGTPDSPQILTTGTAPIAKMANGDDWPGFEDSTHVFLPSPVGFDGTWYGIVKASVVETGGNLSFQIFHSDTGNPASDGKFWAAVAILVQARP